jgi:hypothetical protein
MRRRLAATVLLLALAPAPALALTAEELAADVGGFLDGLELQLAPARLRHEPLRVEPAGEGFRVTIPALAIVGVEELRDLAIGDVSFLVAEPTPGNYDFSEVAVPERLEFRGPGGETQGSVSFDLQRLSGSLSRDLGELTRLDFALAAFDVRIPAEGVVMWLGQAEARLDTLPDGQGFHRQQQDYRLGDLLVADEEGTLEIAGMSLLASMEGLDLEAYRTLLAIMADIETAAAKGDAGKLDALRQTMSELAAQDPVATDVAQAFTLTGLTGHGEQGQRLGSLDRLGFAITATAERGNPEGAATLLFDGEGLALDPAGVPEAAPYLELIPRRWAIPLRLEKLPLQSLSAAMVDLVFELSLDPFAAETQMELAGESVLRALGAAGSRLIVEGGFVESALLRLTLASALAFDPATPLGLVGTSSLGFFGLDRVLSFAETLADPEAKRIVKMAVLGLMGFGQATAEPDGSVGYKYEFFFAPDGNVTMNGFGMGDLMNQAMPQ